MPFSNRWFSRKATYCEGQWRKRGINCEALGRSHGGFSTKIHIHAEGLGNPVSFTLTGGEVHHSKALVTLMGSGWIKRLGVGACASSRIGWPPTRRTAAASSAPPFVGGAFSW